jgi:hypothetical protein
VSAAYDVSTLPTGGAWPFTWWCRGCGEFLPVDDREHCRGCVPPLEKVLWAQLRTHVDANLALTAAGASPQDPEALGHLEAALAALHLARQFAGVVPDSEDEDVDTRRGRSCSDLNGAEDCA